MEHRKCECCREKFLLKDMKDDLCVCCYNFIQKRKDKTIADLEAKLADLQQENELLISALNGETFINYKLPMENAQLKQQLAEKDKEIEELEQEKEYIRKHKLMFENALVDISKANQDKTSFAVEQLENVKTRIQEDFDYDDLMYWLNKQIKMLKEGK